MGIDDVRDAVAPVGRGSQVRRTDDRSHRRTRSRAAPFVVLMAGACLLGGCTFISEQTADQWKVTYEVTARGGDVASLIDVTYLEGFLRGKPSEPVDAGTVATTNHVDEPGAASWRQEVRITATEEASVTAAPSAAAAVTCRILIDDTVELTSTTAAPGEPVTCKARTPAFEQG